MYWSPVKLHCMVTKSSLQSWEIHPKPLLNFRRKGQLAWCSLRYRLYFCVSKPSFGRRLHQAETGSRLTNGSCAMSFNSNLVVLNNMSNVIVDVGLPTSGRLMTLLSLSPADFKRILTVLVDRRILVSQCCFEYGTCCELHLSNQTLQCPVVTIRCYPWSAGSWQVFHIVGLRVFSRHSADYRIVVAHLTSNSIEGHPCCMHADCLPSLCFWYSNSYHAYEYFCLNTRFKYPYSKRDHTEFWIMRERHGSRTWLVDIRHNGHTCVSTFV